MDTNHDVLNQYFAQLFGERWEPIKEALLQKERQVLYAPHDSAIQGDVEWLESCQWLTDENKSSVGERNAQGLLRYYVMDPASVVVARALEVRPSDQVLDMCAAPGGKTLVLSENLGFDGTIDANEISAARRDRLKKVIQQYIPKDLRLRIFVKGKDGLKYGLVAQGKYDRVLVDAPCSGERHLLANSTELMRWKVKRMSSLAQKQYGLLAAAYMAVRPGGRIVYSTCALSPEENDGVVGRLLKKKADLIKIVRTHAPTPFAEATEFGWIHLPDRCGFGPLYFSVIEKNEN